MRLFRRMLSKPTWQAGHREMAAARRGRPHPKRWGQPEERYAFHYQYAHIGGERLLRIPLPRWIGGLGV